MHLCEVNIGVLTLVSDEQFRRVTGFLESGQAEGATALAGGGRFGDRGYFVEPTVLTNTRPETAGIQAHAGSRGIELPSDSR
jgi:acyl-CoA reductase-like NAD-dependent aldehyde dehydrogenase